MDSPPTAVGKRYRAAQRFGKVSDQALDLIRVEEILDRLRFRQQVDLWLPMNFPVSVSEGESSLHERDLAVDRRVGSAFVLAVGLVLLDRFGGDGFHTPAPEVGVGEQVKPDAALCEDRRRAEFITPIPKPKKRRDSLRAS